MNPTRTEIVSREDEPLVLVNSNDEELGSLAKAACHDGDGVLHRAFSLFVFNADGKTLLQRRHASKRLWPHYWSNGCCSHPRPGERLDAAVRRRAWDELGLLVTARFVFKFEYQAAYCDIGSEHELCSVYVGRAAGEPRVNTTEVAAWRWIEPQDLDREIHEAPARFTPWMKLEWQRLRAEYATHLD